VKDRHVIKQFQDWFERRLDKEQNRLIENHIQDCDDCGRYFSGMKSLLEGTDPARLPHLEPDAFLPARIRALAETRADTATSRVLPLPGRLGFSVMGLSLVAAAVAGLFFGSALSARADETELAADQAIAVAYYEAVSQHDIPDEWEYALGDNGEERP
jgi:hypothetical protein